MVARVRCRNCGSADQSCRCDYDPLQAAAHREPMAFVSGYMAGWRSALSFAEMTGLNFAPHPFFQASPVWVASQVLLNEIAPMVHREMPFAL